MRIAFSGMPLERDDRLRVDAEALAAARQSDGLLLMLDGLAPDLGEDNALRFRPASDTADDDELVFLGRKDGRAVFARVPGEGDPDPAYAHRKSWQAMAVMPSEDLALFGRARSLLDWNARHGFCARCGHGSVPVRGGWQRDCPNCGAEHFPRVDPVAIMLVEHEGDLLLGRQAKFPPGRFSALAGFIESGETIEEGVSREVHEEVGLRLSGVRYIASQPWPFPSQLMIACIGYAGARRLTIDKSEIDDARWFTRADVVEAMTRGDESSSFIAPPPQAIAHTMLAWWLEQGE